MSKKLVRYNLLVSAPVRAIVSSTNAGPIQITSGAAHGLSTGDYVKVTGHAVNTAANGTWKITVNGAATFILDGSTGNGVGAGTGIWAISSKAIDVTDFDSVVLAFDTDGGGDAAFTCKVAGSISETVPDFALPQTASNQYDYLDSIDLQSGAQIAGDTGFVVATADDHRMLEVNTNGLKWITVVFTAGTAGELTVKAALFGN